MLFFAILFGFSLRRWANAAPAVPSAAAPERAALTFIASRLSLRDAVKKSCLCEKKSRV